MIHALQKHIQRYWRYAQHHIRPTSVIQYLLITVILVSITTSGAYYTLGNLFFGKYPSLYNVAFAEFFFYHAAHPLIGKPVPFAYHQLSRTEFIQGELEQALWDAKQEIQHYPENNSTYYILGLTYGYLKQEHAAIDAFQKFIAASPHSWAARNDCAWLQFRIGDIDGALATIAPVATTTSNPWIQNTYGTLLMNKKRYTEARNAFLYAQKAVSTMGETTWGKAYPGNDPRVYSTGLAAMKSSIENNLKLLDTKRQ